IVLDFVSKQMTVDFRPRRSKYKPPAGTLSLPLRREGIGSYFVTLFLEDRGPTEFLLATGSEVVYLSPDTIKSLGLTKKDQVNDAYYPVYFQIGAREVGTWALVNDETYLKQTHPTNLLGLEFLARFRVVLDYRDKMLYLEPSK